MKLLQRVLGDHSAELRDDLVLSVEDVSKWYPAPKRWRPPRYLRWLPTKPVGGGGFDEDDLDDEFGELLEDAPAFGERGLRPLSFELGAGRALGLVGPDEIAKDTLIRILARLVPPAAGRVLVRGRVSPLLTFYLQKFVRSSGQEALFEIARFMGWPKALVRERLPEIVAFARVSELAEFGPDVYISLLTRRLILSTALHVDASLYLVAHRFAREDHLFAERCFELLRQRCVEGASVVCTGDLDEVAQICDEAMWFEKGEVVASGTIAEVRAATAGHPPELEATLAQPEPVLLGKAGGFVDVVVDGLRSGAPIEFGLAVGDGDGQTLQLWQPTPFRAEVDGTHRLTVRMPPRTVPTGANRAVLVARIDGEEGTRELLSFEISTDGAADGGEPDLGFHLPSGSTSGDPVKEVDWSVSAVSA